MNQRALAGNKKALGAVQLCEMVYTPKHMDSLDSRSGVPTRSSSSLRAALVHLMRTLCVSRDSKAFVAVSRALSHEEL